MMFFFASFDCDGKASFRRMSRYEFLNGLLHFLFFFMGAGIGSFLNVVIYRLPRGISVNQPRRSFCPTCKNQIPMWLNIPLVSWIMLRGKCAKCGCSISPRYLGVEMLTGLLFYGVFWKVFGGDKITLSPFLQFSGMAVPGLASTACIASNTRLISSMLRPTFSG